MRLKSTKARLTAGNLRQLNFIAAGLYGLQGLLIVLLSSPERATRPVTTGFLAQDNAAGAVGEASGAQAYHTLFDLNVAYLVGALLLFAALFHFLVATRYRRDYETGLKKRLTKVRWLYTGLSLGLLSLIVALLTGMQEAALLVSLFTLIEAVCLSGYVIEKNAAEQATSRLAYTAGIKAAAVVGFVFMLYGAGSHVYGNGIPGFIYFIYISVVLLFAALVINLYLQVKRMGHWEDYLFSEKIFIFASFMGFSAISWQVFAGMLR